MLHMPMYKNVLLKLQDIIILFATWYMK